jgi:phosphoribosylaminoimidazole-succinocarboxamide synthase
MNPWKVGKVKKVYAISDSEFEFEFTDQISVFDKIIPTLIPRKGETLCRTSVFWFERAGTMVSTHFQEFKPPNKMTVKRVRILDNPSPDDTNYLIPLEFIARYYVAGSLHDRLVSGTLDPHSIGLKSFAYGDELPDPFVEVTTKLEKVDRLLTIEEALALSGLEKNEYEDIVEIILKIDADITQEVKKRGLIHVDGKKEFAMDEEREPMIIDTYGTADEDRFWDLRSYENGSCVELSKEFVRSYYRNIGYHEALYAARKEQKKEPDIPPLPPELVEKTSQLYCDIFEMITGCDL